MCSLAIAADGPGPPGRQRSLEALEAEIAELASHIHAATCRWLCLVAEFDRREGWGTWGCRSCAEWVSWRCGIAPVAAREHVRVARRLEELPLVRDAFAAGRLSYSKVRALTRVDNVEREEELLALARDATAAQLERLVRAYRGVVAAEQVAHGERPLERWLTYSYDDDGSLLLRGRLPAEEGALVVAALDAARDWLANDERTAASADASAEAAAAEAEAEAEAASLGVAEATRDETMRDSADAAEPGAGDPTGAGASAEARPEGAGEARADALLLMADTLLASDAGGRTGGDRYQVVVHVDAGGLRHASAPPEAAAAERCELDNGVPLASETARRLACDAALVSLLERDGKPLGVGRKTRSIPPALRRALSARDRGCRFPGCGSRRFVDAHHIQHWADGGATDLPNLVQLCRHHHRLLHEGGYTVQCGGDGRLTFRRPDGRRIRSCPRPPAGRPAALWERRPGDVRGPIAADAWAPAAIQRLDLALAVDAMLACAPVAPRARAAPIAVGAAPAPVSPGSSRGAGPARPPWRRGSRPARTARPARP